MQAHQQLNRGRHSSSAVREHIRAGGLMLVLLVVLAGLPVRLPAVDFVRAPGPYPHGMTTDGTFLWLADYQTRTVYKLDTDGRVISSWTSSFGRPRGLAHQGQTLYVATLDRIVGVEPETGTPLFEIASPDSTSPDHQGLAYGDGRIWVASRGEDDRIFGIDPDSGRVTASFRAPGNNPRGLTFVNGSLWNMDSVDEMIYEISPADGRILVAYPCPLSDGRGLTHHQGAFVQADASLRQLARFQTTGQFAGVYVPANRLDIPNSEYWLPWMRSHPITGKHPQIRRILLIQHGSEDDVVRYYALAREAAREADQLDNTFVASLQLLDDGKLNQPAPPALLYWTSGRFWGGLSAESSGGGAAMPRLSSYDVLDRVLEQLSAETGPFPNLQEIVVAGHSGGAQLVNRYAAVGRFDSAGWLADRRLTVRYVVMNASSYLYFNERRYDSGSSSPVDGVIRFERPASPPSDYNDYGYGLANLISYPSETGATAIQSRYPLKDVTYLVGEADTEEDHLDTRPGALLQGSNRYERGLVYYAHLADHFSTGNLDRHRFLTVPGVGHDALGMATSTEGLQSLFRPLPDLSRVAVGWHAGQLEIRWDTGHILQATDAINGTWQDVPGATSPYRLETGSRPHRFFRTRQP